MACGTHANGQFGTPDADHGQQGNRHTGGSYFAGITQTNEEHQHDDHISSSGHEAGQTDNNYIQTDDQCHAALAFQADHLSLDLIYDTGFLECRDHAEHTDQQDKSFITEARKCFRDGKHSSQRQQNTAGHCCQTKRPLV